MSMSNPINFIKQVAANTFPSEMTKSTAKTIGLEMKNQAINCKRAVVEISSNVGQTVRNLDSAARVRLGSLVQEIRSQLIQPAAPPPRPKNLDHETLAMAKEARGIIKDLDSVLEKAAGGGNHRSNLENSRSMSENQKSYSEDHTLSTESVRSRVSQKPVQSTAPVNPSHVTPMRPLSVVREAHPNEAGEGSHEIETKAPSTPSEGAAKQMMEATEKAQGLIHQLDSALAIAGKTGNSAVLKYAIQETQKELEHLVTAGLDPNIAAKFQERLVECKLTKLELPSEKKQVMQSIIKDLMRGVTENNKVLTEDIAAQFKAQSQGLKVNEHHEMEINGHKFIISKDFQAANGTMIPSVWKKNIEPFAEGGAAKIYGGSWITNPRNAPDLVVKEGEHGEANRLANPSNEVIIPFAVHANGTKPGVAPTATLIRDGDGKFVVAMTRQASDGVAFGKNEPGEKLTAAELTRIVTETIDGLAEIHKVGYYHGDNKAGNLLWNNETKNLMISDFEGARSFSQLFSLEKFPAIEDLLGNYTLLSPQLENKLNHILQQKEAEYEQASASPETQKTILTELMKEVAPLLKANDQYVLGLALCQSLMPSFRLPVGDVALSDSSLASVSLQLSRAKVPDEAKEKIFSLMLGASNVLRAAESSQAPAAGKVSPQELFSGRSFNFLNRLTISNETGISRKIGEISNTIESLARSKDPTLAARADEFRKTLEDYKDKFKKSLDGLPETGTTTQSIDRALAALGRL